MPTHTIGPWKVGKKLGEGATCEVRKSKRDGDSSSYAIKLIKEEYASDDVYMKEVNEIKGLVHDNIIKLIDHGRDLYSKTGKQQTFIVLEYAQGGELFDFIKESGVFEPSVARFYFKQLLEGLSYIHGQGVAHRDLKPENLMLDKNFNLKIADFGFSGNVVDRDGKGIMLTDCVGTRNYMAPELINEQPYSGQGVDLFASGIILFIMIAALPPFGEANINKDPMYRYLAQGKADKFFDQMAAWGKEFDPSFKDFFAKAMSFKPSERPDMDSIKNHTWVLDYTNSADEINSYFHLRKKTMDSSIAGDQEQLRRAQDLQSLHQSSGVYRGREEWGKMIADWKQLDFKDYEDISLSTQFISEDTLEQGAVLIFIELAEYLEKNEVEFEVPDKYFKMNYKWKYQVNKQQVEENKDEQPVYAEIDIKARIEMVVDEDLGDEDDPKIVFQLIRRSGDKLEFLNHWHEIRNTVLKNHVIEARLE